MEETKPRGCKWDTEARLDTHRHRQTQTTLYMEHKGRKNSDRQSFRRGGEREGSRVGIYQPSAQHLRCHPPPYSIVCRPKISVRENLSQNGPESLDLEMKKIREWVQNGWNVRIWSSNRWARWVGGSVNVVGGRCSEGRWIFHGHFYPSYKATLHFSAWTLKFLASIDQIFHLDIFQDKTYYRGSGDFLAETKML